MTADPTVPATVSVHALSVLFAAEERAGDDGRSVLAAYLGREGSADFHFDGEPLPPARLTRDLAGDLAQVRVDTTAAELRIELFSEDPGPGSIPPGEHVLIEVLPSQPPSARGPDHVLHLIGDILVHGTETARLHPVQRRELERRAERIRIISRDTVEERLGAPVGFSLVHFETEQDPRPFFWP